MPPMIPLPAPAFTLGRARAFVLAVHPGSCKLLCPNRAVTLSPESWNSAGMALLCSSQAGVDCPHREHERQEHNVKMKLPGGADLALTVISVSEDLLWGWELVGLGTGSDFVFHKELP